MIVQLSESATVRAIDTVCASILAAYEQDDVLELDASLVAEIDLSLVQLIEAARAHARRESKSIRLTAPANAALMALLHRAGFLSEPTTEDIAFWCHGELPQ